MSAMPEFVPFERPAPPPTQKRRRRRSDHRSERYVSAVAMSLTGTLALAAWIGGFAQRTVAGYRVDRLKVELRAAQQANRDLAQQTALLSDPNRLASAAGASMTRAVPASTLFIPASTDRPVTTLAISPVRIAMRP